MLHAISRALDLSAEKERRKKEEEEEEKEKEKRKREREREKRQRFLLTFVIVLNKVFLIARAERTHQRFFFPVDDDISSPIFLSTSNRLRAR